MLSYKTARSNINLPPLEISTHKYLAFIDTLNSNISITCSRRGVAQPGRALRSGRRGRWFKSGHPDHFYKALMMNKVYFMCYFCSQFS